jgi:hypothetical protein
MRVRSESAHEEQYSKKIRTALWHVCAALRAGVQKKEKDRGLPDKSSIMFWIFFRAAYRWADRSG